MSFNITNLKKAGFKHTPDLDFSDDGTNFKMFSYKGIPVSYAKSDDIYYIAVRLDYLDMRYEEYSKLPSYRDGDEFNGVDERRVDVDKLIETIKKLKVEMEEGQTVPEPEATTYFEFTQKDKEVLTEALYTYMDNIVTDLEEAEVAATLLEELNR